MSKSIIILSFLFTMQFAHSQEGNAKNDSIEFFEFIENFNSDKQFQLNHIEFPLKQTIMDFDGETTEYIAQSDWLHMLFLYADETANREIDAYEHLLEFQYNTVTWKLRGIDNGIRVDYIFKKKNIDWVLTEWNDYSN